MNQLAAKARICLLEDRIEKLDEMDVVTFSDYTGHILFHLFGDDATTAKRLLIEAYRTEIENLRRVERVLVS